MVSPYAARIGLVCAAVLNVVPTSALAFRSGPPSAANGSTASGGASCQDCHGAAVGAGSVQIIGLPAQYSFNVVYNLSVRVADPTKLGAGFQLSVESPLGSHIGTLISSDPTNTQLNPFDNHWINHRLAGVNNSVANWNVLPNTQSAVYNFQWRAPLTDAGPATFWAAGNAINNSGFNDGDIIYLTSQSIGAAPATGACCEDATGTCLDGQTQAACQAMAGFTYRGDNTTCATLNPPCGPPPGSCCDNLSGNCDDDVLESACQGGNETWTEGVDCIDLNPPCVATVTGACCVFATGLCADDQLEAQCAADGGQYGGDGSTCASLIPPCHIPLAISLEVVATGLTAPLVVTHSGAAGARGIVDDRLFIVDQPGRIRIVKNGALLPAPFLTISPPDVIAVNAFFDERGVLGVAFHPDYATNGRFFVRYSKPRAGDPGEPCNQPGFIVGCHEEVLSEFNVIGDPAYSDEANPASEQILFRVNKPQFNHNSGHVGFGPDGFLYFTLGDGGGANDGLADGDPPGSAPTHGPIGNGQNRFAALGKLHRIDVDGGDDFPGDPTRNFAIPPGNPFADGVEGLPEIYSWGYRNAYRFSFENVAGQDSVVLADVGQGLFEELDIIPVAASPGHLNMGWVIREGFSCFDPLNSSVPPVSCATTGGLGEPLLPPVLDYPHPTPCLADADCTALGAACDPIGYCKNIAGIAIVGGHVYQGTAVPALQGKYIFGDFAQAFTLPTGRLYYTELDGPNAFEVKELYLAPNGAPLNQFLFGFGEDAQGELYVCASDNLGPTGTTGVVYRFVPPASQAQGVAPRSVAVTLPPTDSPVAIFIQPNCPAATGKYVGLPAGADNIALLVDDPADAARLDASQWGGTVYIMGLEIAPSQDYKVHTDVGPLGTPSLSPGSSAQTFLWGDVADPFDHSSETEQPDFLDISALVDKFKDVPGAKPYYVADLVGELGGCVPQTDNVDFLDISAVVDAFKGIPYFCLIPCP